MSDLWEQAQEAVQAGNNAQAHVLLANLLRQDRQHVDAWYLLSTIAPSAEQQEVFLKRVLKLDPRHAEAQERLVAIEEAAAVAAPPLAMPISTATDDFEAQARGDTLPPWLAEDAGLVVAAAEAEVSFDFEPEAPVEEIPSWLQDMPDGDWVDESEETPLAVATAAPKPTAAQTTARRQQGGKASPVMLGLVAATAIVLIVLIYVLVTVVIPGLT